MDQTNPLAALLAQYGGGQKRPLLLTGADPSAAIQPYNPQPNLPGSVAAPVPQAQHQRAPSMQMPGMGGQGPMQSAAPQAPSPFGQGSMDNLNMPYWLRQMGLGYNGQAAVKPFDIQPTPFNPADLPSLPSLSSLLG